jgi:hypothetical protein
MKCTLFVNGDLYHSSLLIAALGSYEAHGGRVAVVEDRSVSPLAPRLAIAERMLAFDLRDQSYSICLDTLERVDVYFKRSYYEPHLESLPRAHRAKILPFGLNCALKTSASGTLIAKLLLRNPACIRRLRGTLRTYMRLARAETMERPPSAKAEQVIYFQTRVWQPKEVAGDDFREINENRAAIVRSLRREFGARFKGGLIPTAFARTHYPDAISAEPHVRSRHIQASKAALIGIYSRGLHSSLAFKLAEYLAASKCIVAEPLRNGLPAPLVEGRNYLEFTTVDGCLALCDRLLADPAAAEEMRAANWEYYARHVRFDRRISAWLDACDSAAARARSAVSATATLGFASGGTHGYFNKANDAA